MMMKSRLCGVSTCAVVLATLVPNLEAQAAKLKSDIAFVRGLVKELRFIDYAQYEVAQLKRTYKDSADFKLIAQLVIEISLQGAKRHPDRDARRNLYKQALDQSMAFISRYDGEPVAADARVTMAESCIEFGVFLNEELDIAREETPDKVEELEQEAAEVFRKGIEATNKSEKAFKSTNREIEAFVAWMRRGILLRLHAQAVPKDRGYLAGEADETFDDLILEVGEETILGQKALFEKSKIEEVKGDFDAAISSYKDAIEAIYESLTDEEVTLPESAQRLMFQMMQEVYDRLATVSFKQGRNKDVLDAYKQCLERVKEFRTERDPVFGDSLILTRARVMAASLRQTDVSEALKTAKRINKIHPNDFVGLKAKNLIRDILRHWSDLVTGDLLLEVARGDYQAKQYDAAIAGFKRALNGMDADTRSRLGFDTWVLIGRSNQYMQRFLEATMAYSRALEDYGTEMFAGDDELKRKLKRIVNRASLCMGKVMAASNQSAVFTALKSKVDGQLTQFDLERATANDYLKGLRFKYKKNYKDAAERFFAVQESYPKFELAIGHGIECLFREKKYDEAKAKIAWLRNYAKIHEIGEEDRDRRQYRPQALAWAHYTEGRILYEQARGTDGKPDLTKFKDVEKHFLEFEELHATHARTQMTKVHEMLGHAYLEMGDEAKATERYNTLKTLGETTPDVHKALGVFMFNTYRARCTALETELKAEVEKKLNTTATDAKLRAARLKALNMGLDYAKSVGKPSYSILYNSMRLAQRIEDWSKCEWAAEKILKLYANSTATSLRQVKPLLGFALLRQSGRLQEALDVLNEAEKELGDAAKKTTAYFSVRRYRALALGGWPAYDKDGINYEPNPGMSKPEEAYKIYYNREYYRYNKTRNPAYTLEWYRFLLEAYYFCRQAQRVDSKFKARAQTIFNKAKATDNFATLKGLGVDGVRIANLFAEIE